MSSKIVHNQDHYEVYINGKFYCSADTITEAAREVEECKRNEREMIS